MNPITEYLNKREDLYLTELDKIAIELSIYRDVMPKDRTEFHKELQGFMFDCFWKMKAFNRETHQELIRLIREEIENMPHSAFALVSNDNRRAFDECRGDILDDLQSLEDNLNSNEDFV